MDIEFKTKRLAADCNQDQRAQRRWGAGNARRLRRRLDDLRAAANLADFRKVHPRCHELKGDRQGQLAIDLVHPFRLIVEPADDPPPTRADGGLDWTKVEFLRIVEVEDYHG